MVELLASGITSRSSDATRRATQTVPDFGHLVPTTWELSGPSSESGSCGILAQVAARQGEGMWCRSGVSCGSGSYQAKKAMTYRPIQAGATLGSHVEPCGRAVEQTT